jgi:hypothetical protein
VAEDDVALVAEEVDKAEDEKNPGTINGVNTSDPKKDSREVNGKP